MTQLARFASVVILLCPLVAKSIVVAEHPCGDCNRNGNVNLSETQLCANIALDSQPLELCPSCDINDDGEVTEDEVALLPSGPDCPPVQIDIGSAGRNANGKVFIPITLDNGRFSVGGTQNDILFDNTVLSLPSVARCRINPTIDSQNADCENDPNEVTAPCKNLISSLDVCGDNPQPDGCPPGAGSNITRFRSLVTAFAVQVFNPIPDGLLYECEFDVLHPDALPTNLTNAEVAASRPLGQVIHDVIGSDGAVTDAPPPTPPAVTATASIPLPSTTPTRSATPTSTPTGTVPPTPVGLQIIVGSAGADNQGKAIIPVSLFSGGANVGGMQNDILFDNTIVSLASFSSCQLNPEIGTTPDGCSLDPEEVTLPCKTLNRRLNRCGTSPQPVGCPANAGENISRFRALIASTAVQTTNPLPNGLLYTCSFDVLDADRLPAALINVNAIVASPFGMKLSPVVAVNGAVTDESPPPASSTPTVSPTSPSTETPTSSATPTATTTPTPTSSSTATASFSPTASPTATAPEPATATPTATTSPATCTGDCDTSDSVTVDEITLLVSVALGTQELADCIAGDRNGDQLITVDELLAAVTNGLNGCPGDVVG